MSRAGGQGAEETNLLTVNERGDWISGQLSKLLKILNIRLKMHAFDPVGMLCILRIMVT